MKQVIVFDLGGTLMEYEDMPHSWISYYEDCFNAVNNRYSLKLTENDIRRSVEVLKEYNPRYHPREIEYSPEFLFQKATIHWNTNIALSDIITTFFSGMKLTAKIYDDTAPVIIKLRENGVKVAALTNLPSSMPDSLFKADIPKILDMLDLYVSSEICGYRKPNKEGLAYIARHFDVSARDLIFVGDEKSDIDTAQNTDCISILICRNGEPKNYGQDYTIKNLFELKDVKTLSIFI